MAIRHTIPLDDPAYTDQTDSSSGETISSNPTDSFDSPLDLLSEDDLDEGGVSVEEVAPPMKRPRSALRTTASFQSSPSCRNRSSAAKSRRHRDTAPSDAHSLSRLSRHLASLQALIPPAARSGKDGNVIADALRYQKVLSNEIEVLYKAFPYAKQVNVQRIGSGGLQIEVLCEKKVGLLVALMEAIESCGITLATVNVSCRNGKIKINAISTKDNSQPAASLKVTLMATIMRFNSEF